MIDMLTKLAKYFILLLIIASVDLSAQIQVIGLDELEVSIETNTTDSTQTVSSITEELLNDLYQASYLVAQIDSIVPTEADTLIYVSSGPKINWTIPTMDSAILDVLDTKRFIRPDSIWTANEYIAWRSKVINYLAENGHPFAVFQLEDIFLSGDTLYSHLRIEKGPFVQVGKIESHYDIGINPGLLAQLLRMPAGTMFQWSAIKGLDEKVGTLPYLELSQPSRLSFEDGEAVVTMFLKRKKASTLNLLLGLIPASNIPGNSPGNDLTLTGLADVHTQNLLGKGELFSFKFERLLAQTQTIDLSVEIPYIGGLPFGLAADMNQNRRDTSFNWVSGELGFSSFLGGTQYIELFVGWEESNIIQVDEGFIISQRVLPNTLDTRARNYGVELNFNRLDLPLNPRKGYELMSKSTFSRKAILPNTAITALRDVNQPEFDFSELYTDELLAERWMFRQELEGSLFFPVRKRGVIRYGALGAYQYADRSILRNEQWIIGGNSTLRGFNEGFLFADSYLVQTAEVRFILDRNSYLYSFADIARLWSANRFNDYLGIGIGLTFEVSTGIFGISVAVGKINDSPFDFSSPKIHFGFVNQF